MQLKVYSREVVNYPQFGSYNPYYVTKLVNNYRSHPAILYIPSQLFYDSELQAMADFPTRTSMCDWGGLPVKGFPIIFHGIEGKDMREAKSPSWFNPDEALTVLDYITQLRDRPTTPRVTLGEIGVISPYRKQAEKIKTLLRGKGMEGVKVGSVEEFQGQERRVIIISAVRSKQQEEIPLDLKFNLGFLKNPKRFNVSTTRAKALMIIIGNPHVLSTDPHWSVLLKYCIQNKAYVGCAPPTVLDSNDMDSVISRLGDLRINPNENATPAAAEIMDNDATFKDDPAWLRDM